MTTTQNNGAKPAALSFTYVDDDLDLDQQLELEVKRQNIGPVFNLKKDDEQTVRFVAWKNGVSFLTHEKYERGKDGAEGKYIFKTICARHVGKECNWCDMGTDASSRQGVRTYKVFGQQVFNVTGERPQLLMYPINKASPMEQLLTIHNSRKKRKMGNGFGSIEDMDLTIKQLGENRTRTFVITQEQIADSTYTGEVWDKNLVAEKMITRVSPELIGKKRGDSGNETVEDLDTDDLATELNI